MLVLPCSVNRTLRQCLCYTLSTDWRYQSMALRC